MSINLPPRKPSGNTPPTAPTAPGLLVSLDSATTAGAGDSIDMAVLHSRVVMQTVVTGSPTAVTVNLEGSLDGTHWSTIASSTDTTGAFITYTGSFLHVRANLASLTGGTSPTVTALLAVAV